jgi:hypothetical protein
MKAYRLGILLASAAALGAGFSCGSGGTATSSGSTSSTASGTAAASGTGGNGGATTSSSVATGTGGATTGTSTGTGSPMYGVCSQPCTTPADCCPPGSGASCPGASFPNNYACLKGACDGPHCGGTSDCAAQNPKLDCVTLGGASDCAFGCSTDGDCNAPLTCTGKDDNGKKYCVSMGGGCPDDAFCKGIGLGKCVKGVCSCEQDADCTSPGYTKCAK